MANLINGSQVVEINDNKDHIHACESIGVPFSCEDGRCGTCLVEVIEGSENLSPLNEKEQLFGLAENERLMCQARLQKGDVVIQT